MSMDIHELETESAELLPAREALGRLKFSFHKTVTVTKHVAYVDANNLSIAANVHSPWAEAESAAVQTISIHQ